MVSTQTGPMLVSL